MNTNTDVDDPDNPKKILRRYRDSRGLPVEAICKHYGVGVRTWKRWESENETASPSLKDQFELLRDIFEWHFCG